MRILLVDDHPLIHEIMRAVLTRALKPDAIYAANNFAEAVERASMWVDLVVLDLGLPGYSGIDALTAFRKAFPVLPVVVFTALEDGKAIRAALQAGARGYILKASSIDVMVTAFRLVASGRIYVPPEALRAAPGGPSEMIVGGQDLRFTGRQQDVLRQIGRGLSNRKIARELGISEHTVKQHARVIFRTLGVANRTEAVITAARVGVRFD